MTENAALFQIIILLILVVLSAFFSAAETAYTSFNKIRMRRLAKTKKTAMHAINLSHNYNKILTTILIGNNIVNITAASIATVLFTRYYGNLGVTLSTVILTIVILIFGEITPKTLAKERPEGFAMFAALPISFISKILYPLIFLFNHWKKLLIKIFKLNKKPTLTEEEFKIMVTDIKDEGILNDTEHELIQKTLKYDDTIVSAIMILKKDVTAIEKNQDMQEILKIFKDTNFSRIPVYDKKQIKGIMYRADFYECLITGCKTIDNMIKPALWVESNVKISSLMKQMQRKKQHMAIVGKNGADVGIVTMEDVLEELVGEIEDEYDS